MWRTRPSSFVRDQQGGVAVEFVALMPAFLFIVFFTMEIAIAVLWVGTVEKAAQLGARLAVVSNVVVTGLPADGRNPVNGSTFAPGQNCNLSVAANADPCVRFAARTCTAGTVGQCAAPATGFNPIFNRMDAIVGVLVPANVTITYEYVGLGFAGGPIAPRVTVTVGQAGAGTQAVPYNTVMTSMLARLIRAVTGRPTAQFPGLTVMPVVSATFTGEDLSSAAAS